MGTAFCIGAVGATTPIGRDAASSAAAVRAGISGFDNHPLATDATGQPIRVAQASWLAPDLQGAARFEGLLSPALDQAVAPIVASGARVRVGLILALPEARPGVPMRLTESLRALAASRFAFCETGTVGAGAAAGLLAVASACSRLAGGFVDACVVAAVDSHTGAPTLEWLEDNEQIHGAGHANNAWGFVPGEAAGALLIATAATLTRLTLTPLARVLSVGNATESRRIKTMTICTGEGMTAAFTASLAKLPPGQRVTDVVCDLNGEPYRSDEFGFATMRTRQQFESPSDFVAPADCWGDVATATGPLAAMLAVMAARKGYSNGDYPLVCAGSENGQRAAMLLHAPRTDTD